MLCDSQSGHLAVHVADEWVSQLLLCVADEWVSQL